MRVFIGSSKNGLKYARELKVLLEDRIGDLIDCILWSDNEVFKLTYGTLDSLINIGEKLRAEKGYAILVFTPDDEVKMNYLKSNAKTYKIARDNVIFELGLFLGFLGQDNVICVSPRNVDDFRILSDWDGINDAKYDYKKSHIRKGLVEAAEKISMPLLF